MYVLVCETSLSNVQDKMLQKVVSDDMKLSAKSKMDLVRLPPCENSLIPHMQRVNYRVSCYKRANKTIFEKQKPYAAGHGWTRTEEGPVEPMWSMGPILPPTLVHILETGVCDEEEEGEDELDYFDDDE